MAGPEMTSVMGSNPVLTRKLASADKKTRDKAVALLALWLSCQHEVDEESLMKVWKGLFYCVWHADKAPVQAELIENLAGLLEKADVDVSVTFFKVFLSTMRREWSGIDKLRLDKFYLLLRRFLSHMFKVLDSRGWDHTLTVKFMEALEERVFLATDKFAALGINLHFTDVYWDEFRKFLPAPRGVLELLLKPFYSILSKSTEKSLLKRVRENVFDNLVEDGRIFSQDIQVEGSEKAARNLGYLLHSTPIVSQLFLLASSPSTPQANRKVLYELHDEFSKVAKLLDAIEVTVYDNYFQRKQSRLLESVAGQVAQVEPEEEIEEGDRMSKSRLIKRKQARAQALGVRDPVSFKPKKTSKSKKALSKKNYDELSGIGNGDHHEPQGGDEEGGVGDETTKKRSLKSVVTVGINLPLLQKRLAKRKGKKKKKKDPVYVASELGSEGSGPVVENTIDQSAASPTSVNENGHQNISDVTMNLEKQFDFVAVEDQGRAKSLESSLSPDFSRETRSKRKRKKDKSAVEAVHEADDIFNGVQNAGGSTPANTEDGNGASVKKSKKVRFALRNNIVWKPQGPLPPLSVRTPPSATPRGSALKVGVPPGPIRTRPIRATRGTGVKSRKRVMKQYISGSSQKSTRTSSRKVRRQTL